MTSSLVKVDILATALRGGPLDVAITGSIYKHTRPASSQLEDVVINTLANGSEDLQESILNVNIHVPNLKVTVGGVTETNQPDHVRLKALSALAIAELNEKWGPDYNFRIDSDDLVEEESSSYINFRIHFYSLNLSTY